jgi:hypothetical protein
MNVETFALCDAATDQRGKLNVLGAFDTLWAKQVPVQHPHCAIAVRIRFSAIERGQHKVAVNFVDLDGKALIPPAEGPVSVNFADEQRSGAANIILNIQQLQIPQFGTYSIDLAIDGRNEASLPLFVKKKAQAR